MNMPNQTGRLDITMRQELIGLTLPQIKEALITIGEKPFRASQIYHFIYGLGARSFDDMSNINKETRKKLGEIFTIDRPTIKTKQPSRDGTIKWLLEFHDANQVELVYIPDNDRGTLCISSQVGCTLTCSFCHTGTQRMVRNLTAGEILAQVMVARDELGDWPSSKLDRQISNVVFMGMGEPLYNTDNVIKALILLQDGDGMSLSKRKITLSTSGIVPHIARVGHETGVNLAISLHAVRDELRDQLVPINKKYPLAQLIDAVKHYPAIYHTNSEEFKGRRVTWEYVMLKGINDSRADARELVRLIKGIPSKVNLIPFNPWAGSDYQCSDEDTIEDFAQIIRDAGYASPVRRPRGRDISAACGQLKSESQKLSARETRLIESA